MICAASHSARHASTACAAALRCRSVTAIFDPIFTIVATCNRRAACMPAPLTPQISIRDFAAILDIADIGSGGMSRCKSLIYLVYSAIWTFWTFGHAILAGMRAGAMRSRTHTRAQHVQMSRMSKRDKYIYISITYQVDNCWTLRTFARKQLKTAVNSMAWSRFGGAV